MRPLPSSRVAAVQAALLAALALASPALAQTRAFTIEDVYRVQSVSDVQIAPDGRHVAYSWARPTSVVPHARRTSG